MEIANGRLRLNKVGSDIPIVGLTPAEALVLHILHQGNNGGSTFGEEFDKIKVEGEAKVETEAAVPEEKDLDGKVTQKAVAAKIRVRTDAEELRRLKAKYGSNVNKKGDRIVGLIWPGVDVKLPQKFSELNWKELAYDGVEVAAVNYITGTPVAAKS